MKKQILVLFLLGMFAGFSKINSVQAQDVAKVAGHVYKQLVDTLGIRIFEVTFKPGDKVAVHSHPDHTVYVLSGGTLEIINDKGMKEVHEIPTGMTMVFPAETHSAQNIGTTTIKAMVTEINRDRPASKMAKKSAKK